MRSAYLDTSAISLLFQDDSPERQEVTREFFKHLVIPGRCRTVISPVVVDELGGDSGSAALGVKKKVGGLLARCINAFQRA